MVADSTAPDPNALPSRHDMINELSVILLATSVLAREDLDPEIRQICHGAMVSARRLHTMIDAYIPPRQVKIDQPLRLCPGDARG